MTEQPHIDLYSLTARICLGIAIFGGALAIAITSVYLTG